MLNSSNTRTNSNNDINRNNGINNNNSITSINDIIIVTLAYRHLCGDMIETLKIIRHVYDSAVSPVTSMAGQNQRPTWRYAYNLYKRRTKTRCRQLFFLLKEFLMCGTASHVILWRLQVFERRICWRDQDIVYNYEAGMSLVHTDQA